MSDLVRIIEDVALAENTILRRRAWDEVEITPSLQAGIEQHGAERALSRTGGGPRAGDAVERPVGMGLIRTGPDGHGPQAGTVGQLLESGEHEIPSSRLVRAQTARLVVGQHDDLASQRRGSADRNPNP